MRRIQWCQFHQVLSSHSLINFQIRFLDPQKLAGPVRIASKITKNSAIDSFWWVENDPVILEGSIKLFWLNKFKKNDLKWKLIGNQGPLSAFQRPLNLRGRVYQKSSYLQVVKGTAAAMQIIFSNSTSSWATLRYIWSPRTLNWDHIFRPKIRPNPSAHGKNFGGVFFDVFRWAEISNWLTLSVHDCTRKVLTYRWSRAPPLPRKSFSAIQLHHEPLWGTFGHPGPWIGTIYLGQKLGRTHPLVGKTSEVCFSMYFDELIKILKKYCQNIAWELRYQIDWLCLSTTVLHKGPTSILVHTARQATQVGCPGNNTGPMMAFRKQVGE